MLTETFTSATGTYVKFDIYLPKIVIRYKAVVQVHHASGVHSGHYKRFAQFLAHEGYVVIVTDFPGHGTSLHNYEQGYFGYGDPTQTLVSDMQRLRDIINRRYPDLPYFMIGDQFGSIVLRKYLTKYGDFINGAILLSTCGKLRIKSLANIAIMLDSKVRGRMHRSKTIDKIININFKRGVAKKNENYRFSDKKQLEIYQNDPFTRFVYTNDALHSMLKLINEVSDDSLIKKTPSYLSILILSGKKDRLGSCGKGPTWLYNQYKKNNIQDVTLKIFKESRADLLHDISYRETFKEIVMWLDQRVYI